MAERAEELDSWITNLERQCIEEVEQAPDLESQVQSERDTSSQKLWLLFQNTATCVAQLYTDRQNEVSQWVPFQNAASSVTNLYKECLEAQQRVSELDFQWGYQRCIKDLLAWAKKHKRHIRREELLAFLCGKAPHHPHQYHDWASPRPSLYLEPRVAATAPPSSMLNLATAEEHSAVVGSGDPNDVNLDTFRGALALSSTLGSGRVHSEDSVSPPGFRSAASLSSFTAEEFSRHVEPRKRTTPESTSPGDVVMDSPTHKRPRLI
ncbi:HUWE1-associated protein modifying stress responses-like [Dermacentor andersoni]|uniref:HUWE1-associated protein modifying stress responses-like n=1 Tax=Dermacentor andersoni TaxID=34620 RepID=UPI0021550E1D|nr:HUWE1-associated protein modifying stress responses-like [Dermacentor andersoni]